MDIELPLHIRRQPDATTCGPTSLHALYRYFDDPIALEEVIAEVHVLETGGTMAAHLAAHALRRGYEVEAWAFHTGHFDPTWFRREGADIPALLRARLLAKGLSGNRRYEDALADTEEFFARGGKLRSGDLTPELIVSLLRQGTPILAGTNGTWLYQCSRESSAGPDDVAGDAIGHFVVVHGWRESDRSVAIADPLRDNPATGTSHWRTDVHRLIGAIYLAAATDDSTLLVLRPKGWVARAG